MSLVYKSSTSISMPNRQQRLSVHPYTSTSSNRIPRRDMGNTLIYLEIT
jgi:hypothetical protein